MSIYSLWNPENDEAIFSPGDQKPFSTLIRIDSDKHTHTDKTLEYELHGTVLNEICRSRNIPKKDGAIAPSFFFYLSNFSFAKASANAVLIGSSLFCFFI
ncbi:hypothetical protein QNH26_26195 [Peribacillus frigoritolerans]|nr:hypothetical protein [Peribacillus frigoritolerans]WHX67046.1 hypothetical protein QNH26_26195 [Peribacillus frigoritolerans]